MPAGNTIANQNRPHWVYLLLNDEGAPFWIGISARPDGRLAEHRAEFRGVRDLRMLVLGQFGDQRAANEAEKATARALARAGVGLANFNYVVDKASRESRARHAALWRSYTRSP